MARIDDNPQVSTAKSHRHLDFQEVQRGRWKTSLFVFTMLSIFYVLAVGLMLFAGIAIFSLFRMDINPLEVPADPRFIAATLGLALLIAIVHFLDARWNGARTIIDRLRAQEPDPEDRFHKEYENLTHEMAIASGIPKIRALVLPSHAINSMALIDAEGTPVVLASEGLLAECSRDETQAAVAHELAHILSGDTFYVTLVCSLAGFFERLRDALEPDPENAGSSYGYGRQQGSGIEGIQGIFYLIALKVSVILRLLACTISREREYLADARAVDFTRNPLALGRVLYRAQLNSNFLGDFSAAFSPLFIVASSGEASEGEGLFARLFSTHPPIRKRLQAIAGMGFTSELEIMKSVWDNQKEREEKLREIDSASGEDEVAPDRLREASPDLGARIWQIRDPKGRWQGPFKPAELVALPFFAPMAYVRNTVDNYVSPASEFMPVLHEMTAQQEGAAASRPGRGKCPHGHGSLTERPYEGIPVLECPKCQGRLVRSRDDVGKILVRKDFRFSKRLVEKAREMSRKLMVNPNKIGGLHAAEHQRLTCPSCEGLMSPRPYNYQYFLPVDECLACRCVWFDTDEMEILQIWIERGQKAGI